MNRPFLLLIGATALFLVGCADSLVSDEDSSSRGPASTYNAESHLPPPPRDQSGGIPRY